MRIRKHAKISPLLYAATSLKPGTVFQTHVCQLNQSPWDVITFPPPDPSVLPPPPAFLLDKDYTYWTNETSDDHIAADESSPASSEKWDGIAFDNGGTGTEKQDKQLRSKKDGEDQICCYKIDGKGGQCRRKVKNGQSFCEHHSSQVKISSNLAQPAAKNSESGRQTRAKKPASSSNPHEFYYYSGFGPRWGKKRGLRLPAPTAIKEEEPCTSTESSSDTSSKTNTTNINTEIADEGPVFLEPDVKYSSLSSDQIDKEGLDYVEEDDDEDDGEMGRKRARKPIKARSLKSLM